MLLRIAVIFLLNSICSAAMGFTSSTYSEVIDVPLHDGRHIEVERTVQSKTELRIFHPIIGILPRFESTGPNTFHLKFKHPDTQETISWQGELHYTPVLLDIVSGVPYLVVYGFTSKATEAVYGCPELPYFYLKYESGFFGKWMAVSVEKAPAVLRVANLPNVDGLFQEDIPRTYEEWRYAYKNNHRNERLQGDCRPPLKPLPDISMPNPLDIELETVENQEGIVRTSDDYYKSLSAHTGTIISANCSKLLLPPNPENLMFGKRFINDQTGNKRLPYSGPIPFPLGEMLEQRSESFCDDKYIWVIAKREELGKTIISKFTSSGDILYSVRMTNPTTPTAKLERNLLKDSFTSENGYFYFYWRQDLPILSNTPKQYPYRITKFRFREPTQDLISK